ncbi:MAG: potassium channel protein, partial [Bacteroidota bacterium]
TELMPHLIWSHKGRALSATFQNCSIRIFHQFLLAFGMELGHSIRRMLYAVGFLLLISVIGTIGFAWIEDLGLADAVYMSITTMSTVGYGWEHPPSTAGKTFAVFLIIISAGTFIYAVGIITSFIVEGEMRQILNRYQYSKKVKELKDHIIVCGLGRNGREAVKELLEQEQMFVVIEKDEDAIEQFVRENEEILVINGDATLEEVLERANIHTAKGLISSLSSDAENVYITLTARGMNPALSIVARANYENVIPKLKRAGANRVIVPNLIGGKKMTNVLTRPALVEFIDLISGQGHSNLSLEDLLCQGHSKIIGKSLVELNIRSKTGVLVLGYKRGYQGITLNPDVREKLSERDRLFIMGTKKQLEKFREEFMDE